MLFISFTHAPTERLQQFMSSYAVGRTKLQIIKDSLNTKWYAVWRSLVAFLVFLFLDSRHLVNGISKGADKVQCLHEAVQIARGTLIKKAFERLNLRKLLVIGPLSQMMIYPELYGQLFGVAILPHNLGARELTKLRKAVRLNLKIRTLLLEFEDLFPISLTDPFLSLVEKGKLDFDLSVHISLLDFFGRRYGLQINPWLTWSRLSLSVNVLIWPITWFKLKAPKHSIDRLKEAGLNVMAPIIMYLIIFVNKLMNFVEKWFPAKIVKNPQKRGLTIGLDSPKHLLITMELLPNLFALGMFTWAKPLDQI